MSPTLIATNWFASFNKQNVDDLLSLYDDNAEHFSPRLLKIIETKSDQGKSAMKIGGKVRLTKCLRTISSIEIREEGYCFLEYKRKVDGEAEQIVKEYLQVKDGRLFSKVL